MESKNQIIKDIDILMDHNEIIKNIERDKRDLDFNFAADHDQALGTDVNAEAIANLWKSKDGKTIIDGSARYNQHFGINGMDNGNARYGGKITVKKIY